MTEQETIAQAVEACALVVESRMRDMNDPRNRHCGERNREYQRLAESLRALAPSLAIRPPAPESETPPEPSWGNADTVGNFIAQLRTIDPAEPIFAGFHVKMDDGRMLSKVCGLHISWEHVSDRRHITGKKGEGVRTLVAWAGEPAPESGEVTQADKDRASGCYNALSRIFERVNVRYELVQYLAPVLARHRLASLDALRPAGAGLVGETK